MAKRKTERRSSEFINNTGNRGTFVYKDDDALDKPLDFAQLRRLLGYMAPHKAEVAKAIVCTLAATVLRLMVPISIGMVIDKGLKAANMGFTGIILGILAVIYVGQWIINTIRIGVVNRLGQGVLTDLRSSLFKHVQYLSIDFFDKRPAGSILVRITNDVDSLQELFTSGIVNLLVDLVAIVAIAVIILIISPKLALVSMTVLPIMFLVSTRLRRTISHCWDWVRTTRTRINIHLNEALQGMKVTQGFVRESVNADFFGTINGDHKQAWVQGTLVADTFGPIIEFTGALGTCLVYWYGAILIRDGSLTLGLLVSFANYLGNFWEPISRLGNVYNQMLQAMASSDRIFELLDTKTRIMENDDAITDMKINGDIVFDDVTFAYTPDRPALKGIDLTIKAGQMVALVGHTGSGKTTIANLIQRSYDATGGKILVDGRNVTEYGLECLRSQIGVVLQDTYLFTGTLMDNIRFGKLSASDEEAERAAEVVSADAFIRQLPDGYHTEVFERGSGISMGQRQLISFARAVLADPRILILDEATASIDTEMEALIQKALAKVLQGRTSIVVAHRLSTIRQADLIVVLDHGEIVETGNHNELMTLDGVYANLIKSQYKAVIEGDAFSSRSAG